VATGDGQEGDHLTEGDLRGQRGKGGDASQIALTMTQ
jgi:hypothetical protein